MAKKHGPVFIREGIANLHDVLLNASVLRNRMLASPVEHDPQNLFFHLVTDRFRLERLWMMELYVLVEAWRSKVMAPVRARLASNEVLHHEADQRLPRQPRFAAVATSLKSTADLLLPSSGKAAIHPKSLTAANAFWY